MDTLVRTLRSYAEFTDIVTVMLFTGVSLPEEERAWHRHAQNDYLAEWVAMLRNARSAQDQRSGRDHRVRARSIGRAGTRLTPSGEAFPGTRSW